MNALADVDSAEMIAGPDTVERKVYLHPGRICFASEPTIVTTILGSCVSVCLFDERSGLAGVNHYLLPGRGARAASPRFGDTANETLLHWFVERRSNVASLRAKVFGGASTIGGSAGDLAGRNVEEAIAFLRRHDIAIAAQDTGGTRGRKVVYRTSDGSAWVRLL
jgi:chemotaxis protein CheD